MSLVAFITDPGKGGHFLNWSVLYLSGKDNYYSCYSQRYETLVDNPIVKDNAHGFDANQPETLEEFYKIILDIENTEPGTFNTIYFHNFRGETPEVSKGTEQALKHVQLLDNTKIVILSNQQKHSLYSCMYAIRAIDTEEATIEHHKKFIDTYFNESNAVWQKLQLNDVWDHREFLALNLKPHYVTRIEPKFQSINGHFFLEAFDLFNCFDNTVRDLFDHLDLTINESRWDNWISVYRKWQNIHKERMRFVWYFDTIVEAIVKGWDMDLSRFDLDIIQEAAIQHTLIYKHNLNLKTWQLEKFLNTKQLHNLLEPNQHQLAV